jgi:hypothetical protein
MDKVFIKEAELTPYEDMVDILDNIYKGDAYQFLYHLLYMMGHDKIKPYFDDIRKTHGDNRDSSNG